jgi:hypothetical protein
MRNRTLEAISAIAAERTVLLVGRECTARWLPSEGIHRKQAGHQDQQSGF